MARDDDTRRWKQKYYDNLGQLESKEKQWRDIESLLRRGITRLSLAAGGADPTLDRELETLRGTDFLARYGGEEFVILMPETDVAAALPVAEKLRAAIEVSGFHYREQHVPITVSCGIAGFRDDDTPETVFGRADSALYRAKKAGGNQCIADQ